METVCVKFDDKFLEEVERIMIKHNYITKTEFVRESIRDKIKELEKQGILSKLKKVYGASKRRTTDEELHAAREKAFKELERELK